MPEVQIPAIKGNVYLQRLPKDKTVMDFVCSKFIDSSPERYEMVAELLERYRTLAGFDPMMLSKARFKRVKSADFKKMLESIDQKVGDIMATAEYRQVIAKQVGFEPLFQEYTTLSEQLNVHPPASMVHEVVNFEEILKNTEAYELLLSFYRQHTSFYTLINEGDEIEKLIADFDNATERNNRLVRQTRSSFVLKALEQHTVRGNYKEEELLSLIEELDLLYSAETDVVTRYEQLIKIVKAALLTVTPNRILEIYIATIEEDLQQLHLYFPDADLLLNEVLAHHHYSAGSEKRMQWWSSADAIARKSVAAALNMEESRANLRIVKAAIALGSENIEQALRALDEAEHQIYKANRRSLTAKNCWITICEQRLLLYAVQQLSGVAIYTNDQYHELIRLVEELSKHRKDAATHLLEMKGILYFIQRDWETALEFFERAMNYRTEHPSHPYYSLTSYFTLLLKSKEGKKNTASFVSNLQLCNDPFYTFTGTALMKQAAIYFAENSKKGKK